MFSPAEVAMSDASSSGQVSATPEGGPLDAGVPVSEPGAGQVRSTPEAGPLPENEVLVPPTWREHMSGPILGLDDTPSASSAAARDQVTKETSRDRPERPSARDAAATEELRKWPPYSGKPVSEVRWDALRYAAPVVSQAERLAIQAIDLSGRGLSKLARYLETRRKEREAEQSRSHDRSH
jgi:hypothetical protein